MKISILFDAQMRQFVGIDRMEIEATDGDSLHDVLMSTANQAGDQLKQRLFRNDQTLQPTILLFVNQLAIAANDAASHILSDGDEVCLYPPISGG